MWDEDEPEDTDAGAEPRVRDLVRAGTLPVRHTLGDRVWARIATPRQTWRPAGCSARLWKRVTGEDPFETTLEGGFARVSVYAEGRLDRLSAAPAEAPSRPRAPAERDGGNQGESLIPEGFRNLPVSRSAPAAKPAAAVRPAARPRPEPPPTPAPSLPVYSPTGRVRGAVRRTPAGVEAAPAAPMAAPPPVPTASVEAPAPAQPTATHAPAAPAATAPAGAAPRPAPDEGDTPLPARPAETLDDALAAPSEGRARLKPRR